jgi:hypothetical protein
VSCADAHDAIVSTIPAAETNLHCDPLDMIGS